MSSRSRERIRPSVSLTWLRGSELATFRRSVQHLPRLFEHLGAHLARSVEKPDARRQLSELRLRDIDGESGSLPSDFCAMEHGR